MIDLLQETKRLLEERDQTFEEIANGSGVGYHWLTKFSRDAHDPRISKLQRLYNYLQSRKQEQAA